MSTVVLPYQASRAWLETQILSGRPLDSREQTLVVDLDALDSALTERIETVRNAFVRLVAGLTVVFDSGLDPSRSFGEAAGERVERMDAPVAAIVGDLPETDEPTTDPMSVLTAWESWLERYMSEALLRIEMLNEWSPAHEVSTWTEETRPGWGKVELEIGPSEKVSVHASDGAAAMRDALAIRLRDRWTTRLFDDASVAAARQATEPAAEIIRGGALEQAPEEIAHRLLGRSKRIYAIARAHHEARRSSVPSFEDEMRRWTSVQGSERLRLGLEDGYRMNARYLAERLAAEAPGFYAVATSGVGDGWAAKATSPSQEALELRRRVARAISKHAPQTLEGVPEVEIMLVKEPPHEIYRPDPGRPSYPDREGWPWRDLAGAIVHGASPLPFEAVVVKNWLGRFHLIGGVMDGDGEGPPGIWAVPDPAHFFDDGYVEAQDPDREEPPRAKRKPPGPSKLGDDAIPF